MKKLSKFLIAFLLILVGSTAQVHASSIEDILGQYENTTQSIEEMVKEDAKSYLSYFGSMNEESLAFMIDNNVGFMKRAAEAMQDYRENGTLGDFVEITDVSLSEKEKSNYIVTVTGKFEKVDLKMTMEYKLIAEQLTPVEISFKLVEENTSMSKKLSDAALNTVMGLFTVFAVLVLISFIISRFKYIPELEKKMAERKAAKEGLQTESDAVETVAAEAVPQEELVDDLELVAVITAAICAATGASSDGFVVRSIRKSKRNA